MHKFTKLGFVLSAFLLSLFVSRIVLADTAPHISSIDVHPNGNNNYTVTVNAYDPDNQMTSIDIWYGLAGNTTDSHAIKSCTFAATNRYYCVGKFDMNFGSSTSGSSGVVIDVWADVWRDSNHKCSSSPTYDFSANQYNFERCGVTAVRMSTADVPKRSGRAAPTEVITFLSEGQTGQNFDINVAGHDDNGMMTDIWVYQSATRNDMREIGHCTFSPVTDYTCKVTIPNYQPLIGSAGGAIVVANVFSDLEKCTSSPWYDFVNNPNGFADCTSARKSLPVPSTSPSQESPTPTSAPNATATTAPTDTPEYTVKYQVAYDNYPTDWSTIPEQDYTTDGIKISHTFSSDRGDKFIFVRFKTNKGRVSDPPNQLKLSYAPSSSAGLSCGAPCSTGTWKDVITTEDLTLFGITASGPIQSQDDYVIGNTLYSVTWKGDHGYLRQVPIGADGKPNFSGQQFREAATVNDLGSMGVSASGPFQSQSDFVAGRTLYTVIWKGNHGYVRQVPLGTNDIPNFSGQQFREAATVNDLGSMGVSASGPFQSETNYVVGNTLYTAIWKGGRGFIRSVPIENGSPHFSGQQFRDVGAIAEAGVPGSGDFQSQDIYRIGQTLYQIIWRGNHGYLKEIPIVNGTPDFSGVTESGCGNGLVCSSGVCKLPACVNQSCSCTQPTFPAPETVTVPDGYIPSDNLLTVGSSTRTGRSNVDMKNVRVDGGDQISQWFGSYIAPNQGGYYRVSGTVTGSGTIQIDEYEAAPDNTRQPNRFIRSYPNNSTFRIADNHYFVVLLRTYGSDPVSYADVSLVKYGPAATPTPTALPTADSAMVTLCNGTRKTWSEVDFALGKGNPTKGANYPGPFDHGQTELNAYNNAACPGGRGAATPTPTTAPTRVPTPTPTPANIINQLTNTVGNLLNINPTATPTPLLSSGISPSSSNPYDLNNDGVVNAFDTGLFLSLMQNAAATGSVDPRLDYNHDGRIGMEDYTILSQQVRSGGR